MIQIALNEILENITINVLILGSSFVMKKGGN
jgi:hypothetical protein